jgi:hypothetical protein
MAFDIKITIPTPIVFNIILKAYQTIKILKCNIDVLYVLFIILNLAYRPSYGEMSLPNLFSTNECSS